MISPAVLPRLAVSKMDSYFQFKMLINYCQMNVLTRKESLSRMWDLEPEFVYETLWMIKPNLWLDLMTVFIFKNNLFIEKYQNNNLEICIECQSTNQNWYCNWTLLVYFDDDDCCGNKC